MRFLVTLFFLIYILSQRKQKKNKQIGLYETTILLHSKENHEQKKTQPTEWDNIFAHMSDKRLICKMHKELIRLYTKKQIIQ